MSKSLAAAREAKAKADARRAESDVEHVKHYEDFVRREAATFAKYRAGIVSYEDWRNLWSTAPKTPTEAQYDNAARLARAAAMSTTTGGTRVPTA